MSSGLHTAEASSDLSFRPNKRRKFYRQRAPTDDDGDASAPAPIEPAASTELPSVDELIGQSHETVTAEVLSGEESKVSVAEILRQRKTARRRQGGIDFSTTNNAKPAILPASDAIVLKEDPVEQLKAVVDRFAPQTGTGQVADVDKHM